MSQKFHHGDLVHVAKDLGSWMSHFTADIDAIVMYSYKDKYGGSGRHCYCLHLKGQGECSWYDESQLELLESGREDLLAVWEKERKDDIAKHSDLDYIFQQGPDVLNHGAAVTALAKTIGIRNMWGARGEGVTWYENAHMVKELSQRYLEAHDKDGWLAHAPALSKALEIAGDPYGCR